MSKFYVYEHWRPDRDEPFYVGKGSGRRAYHMSGRNSHHKAIQAKLSRLGMCVEVRLVASGLTEDEAFCMEIERIASLQSSGADLANMTIGGEGPSGAKRPPMPLVTREKLSKAHKGKKLSSAHVQKMAAAHRGMKRPPFSDEHKKKLSEGRRGMKFSEEHKRNMSLSRAGIKLRPYPPEHGKKISEAHRRRKEAALRLAIDKEI